MASGIDIRILTSDAGGARFALSEYFTLSSRILKLRYKQLSFVYCVVLVDKLRTIACQPGDIFRIQAILQSQSDERVMSFIRIQSCGNRG